MVAPLVVEKVIHVENMPKIDEAISLSSFVRALLVHGHFEVVESVFMVSVEVSADFLLRVSARNILYHKVRSGLLAVEKLRDVEGATVVPTVAPLT